VPQPWFESFESLWKTIGRVTTTAWESGVAARVAVMLAIHRTRLSFETGRTQGLHMTSASWTMLAGRSRSSAEQYIPCGKLTWMTR